MTPVACLGCIPTFWGDASTLTLHRAGEMEVHLGGRDCASLIALSPGETVDRDLLQTNVAAAAAEAFARLRKGDVNEAERALGMESDAAVYRMEPKKTVLARTRKWLLRAVGLLMIAEGLWMQQMQRSIEGGKAHMAPPSPPAHVETTAEER